MKLYHVVTTLLSLAGAVTAFLQPVNQARTGASSLMMSPDAWLQDRHYNQHQHQQHNQQQQQQEQQHLERYQNNGPNNRRQQQFALEGDAQQWMNQQDEFGPPNRYGNQQQQSRGRRVQQGGRYNNMERMGGQGGRGGPPQGQLSYNQRGQVGGPGPQQYQQYPNPDMYMVGQDYQGHSAGPRYERYRKHQQDGRSPYRDYTSDDFVNNSRGSNRMGQSHGNTMSYNYDVRPQQFQGHQQGGYDSHGQQQWSHDDDYRYGTGSGSRQSYGYGNFH